MTTIHFRFGPQRERYNPKYGDLRMQKGVLQMRVFRRTECGMYVCSSGRQLYDWVDVPEKDLPKQMTKFQEQQKNANV